MSTRLSVDLFLIGLLGSVVAWASHAPANPPARAAYLCAPLVFASSVTFALESLVADESNVVPPTPRWRFDAGRACGRVVIRVSEDLGR
jgi:hypothetical protein